MRGTRKEYDQPSRGDVEALVGAFLDKGFRESVRGGFAEVPEGDVEELDALLLALVKHRYEPDPDGDRPVRWSLCDWTEFEPYHYQYLPHSDEDGDKDEARLDIALLNLGIAMDDVHKAQNCLRFSREKK